MRKFFIYFLIIFFVAILQTSSVPLLFGEGWIPDMLLSLVLAWALIDGFEKFFPWAIFAGILQDLSSAVPLGISVVVFVLGAYGVSFFSKRLSTEMRGTGFLLSIFFVFSATIGSRIIFLVGFLGKGLFAIETRNFISLAMGFPTVFFWNMIFFFVFFFFINWVEDYFYLRRKDSIRI